LASGQSPLVYDQDRVLSGHPVAAGTDQIKTSCLCSGLCSERSPCTCWSDQNKCVSGLCVERVPRAGWYGRHLPGLAHVQGRGTSTSPVPCTSSRQREKGISVFNLKRLFAEM
jgi:hypothetical protein